MKILNKSEISIQKSKFIGYLVSIEKEDDINLASEFVSSENPKSKHICIGGVIRGEKIFKNDGEVGNPGKVLMSIVERKNLEDKIIVVARIFGGVKLGPAGVSRAFRLCAEKTLDFNEK